MWFSYPYPILLPLLPGLLLILFKPLGRIFRISYLRKDSYGELLGEGSLETFETALSILSNVASYIRLLALALAHIALMVAILAMIGLITGEGIGFQILIVIGLIFGNLLVILIEGILVLINDIRLHFYEFFFKFYQGTGIEFFTFNLKEKYSHIRFKIESAKDIISEEIEKEIDLKKVKDTIDTAIKYISDKYF
jgi:vacuolar-type H+-ATPase subunit I/STV1